MCLQLPMICLSPRSASAPSVRFNLRFFSYWHWLSPLRLLDHLVGEREQLAHTASFAAFTGRALTIFRAGLALNTVGSFVNGLMPARSFVAGFLMTTNFAKPGNKNALFFFNSL